VRRDLYIVVWLLNQRINIFTSIHVFIVERQIIPLKDVVRGEFPNNLADTSDSLVHWVLYNGALNPYYWHWTIVMFSGMLLFFRRYMKFCRYRYWFLILLKRLMEFFCKGPYCSWIWVWTSPIFCAFSIANLVFCYFSKT
jgi:hypothetical protein